MGAGVSAQEEHREQVRLRLVECVQCEAAFTEAAQLKEMYREQSVQVVAMAARIEQLEDGEDLRNAEKELRKLRRFNGRLQAELAQQRKEHPKYAEAEEVFQYWKKTLGKPRAQFTEDREKAVLKALEKYTQRQIAIAILGAKVAAYRDERGVTHDDLELIVRGRKLEGFIDRYQAWRRNQGLEPVNEESTDGNAERQ